MEYEETIGMRRALIALRLVLMAAALTMTVAGWAGYGRYSWGYGHAKYKPAKHHGQYYSPY